MSKFFLSHSSPDKPFVQKLANDLSDYGHSCWLDEWEIKVGDSITQKIEQGLGEADYVVLVLSKRSVASKWVEREWRAKYWEQVNSGTKQVLPCLLEHCDVPILLKDLKYANFVEDYSRGF